MQQAINTAVRYHRKIAFVGLSMTENVRIAKELGYINFEDDLEVPLETALQLPDEQVLLLVTGSQGEPTQKTAPNDLHARSSKPS